MVHKRTQYSLSFPLLSNDVRSQIWQENMKFRENCRITNQSDHYWEYQITNEKCDCDCLEDKIQNIPSISLNKLKHKKLLEHYEKKNNSNLPRNTLQMTNPLSNQDFSLEELSPKEINEIVPYSNRNSQSESSPCSRNRKITLNTSPSKKNKVFLPFGWNDANKDIGKKKTFNIKAPEKEVYSYVVLKNKQKTKTVASERNKTNKHPINKKIQLQKNIHHWEVNNDFIWTTEYREKFSRKTSEKHSPRIINR